jgi:hypothetical protein
MPQIGVVKIEMIAPVTCGEIPHAFFLLTQGYVPVYLRMTIAEKKEQDIHP